MKQPGKQDQSNATQNGAAHLQSPNEKEENKKALSSITGRKRHMPSRYHPCSFAEHTRQKHSTFVTERPVGKSKHDNVFTPPQLQREMPFVAPVFSLTAHDENSLDGFMQKRRTFSSHLISDWWNIYLCLVYHTSPIICNSIINFFQNNNKGQKRGKSVCFYNRRALSTLTFHVKKRLTQTKGNAIINWYISFFRRKNTRIKRQEPLFSACFFQKPRNWSAVIPR